MTRFLMGLDLGKQADYTAISIVELIRPELEPEDKKKQIHQERYGFAPITPEQKAEHPDVVEEIIEIETIYHVRYLLRYPLGTDYTAIVEDVIIALNRSPVKGNCELLVDAGGPGRPVIDLLAKRCNPVAIAITGEGIARQVTPDEWHVPKQDLCSITRLLMEQGRLKVAQELELAELLQTEMANFRMKYTKAANLQFEAREGEHDDLLLSLAMPLWYGAMPEGVGFA